jgi:hypothetical protein
MVGVAGFEPCGLKYPKCEKRVSPGFPIKEFLRISLPFWLLLVPAATPRFRSGGHRVITAVPAKLRLGAQYDSSFDDTF